MTFNNYIWDLYRNSEKGKSEIGLFKKKDFLCLANEFKFENSFEYQDENGKLEKVFPYQEMMKELEEVSVENSTQAQDLFSVKIIDFIKNVQYSEFFDFIEAYSTAFYHKFPEYFIPYYFNSDTYPDFLRLCDNFNITLPQNPPRHDWVKRTWFYFELCQSLHQFRIKIGIDPTEFPAFLYFFGMRCLEKTKEEELPKPSKIYFLGAGAIGGKEEENPDFIFLDNSDNSSTNTWGAGNLNIKKGDLVLMYCVSPRKYLHSIWRALEDSFIEPFRFHYYTVKVGFPQKIKTVEYHELKENSIFKNNPTVRSNMQGMNGRPLSVEEYAELLKIIKEKGQRIDKLPKLPTYNRKIDQIENEHDVELKLIEPLLKDMGIKENEWLRQMPLKMGRQTKYYPDYAIFYNGVKGNEKAKVVLEAKYSINSDKQLYDAFDQARSYALRLQSQKIVLADRDFVWLFKKTNEDFLPDYILKLHWNELTNSDMLHKMKVALLSK